MKIIETVKEMHSFCKEIREAKRSIGFVPTMGALHAGHLSLVRASRNDSEITVVSIFVNPTQFGPEEDFGKYPRDRKGDIKRLESLDIDIVFIPDRSDIYPENAAISVDVGPVGDILCGASRPGHFNGVATIVAKLFNIVMPSRAYFGQKDYQQTVVIRKLVREMNFDTDIVVCPIEREEDGLAMSSRNIYLSKDDRKRAVSLYRAIKHGEELILSGGKDDAQEVINEIKRVMIERNVKDIDYVDIVDPDDLEKVSKIAMPVVIVAAAYLGTTRLIDNIVVANRT